MITTKEEAANEPASCVPPGHSVSLDIQSSKSEVPGSMFSAQLQSSSSNPQSSPSGTRFSPLPSHLLGSLAALLPRFVVLPKHAAETLALWIVHTYCFQFRDVSTYIGVESPEKRCGKTTLLGVLSKLVQRPVVASNISPSAFFRVIQEMQPTLLIDEADTFLQGNDELRGILNAGYHKPGAYVIRVSSMQISEGRRQNSDVQSSKFEVQGSTVGSSSRPSSSGPSTINSLPSTSLTTYTTWCPKFIAAIGHLPETLADRCIVVRMQRKREGEECQRLRDLDSEILNQNSEIINVRPSSHGLRQMCSRFALEHRETIANAKPEIPKALNDRAADIWEPLFVIADIAGGDWPQKARAAALALTSGSQGNSPTGSLLFDLAYLFHFVFKKERVFTEELVMTLNLDHFADRPWREARNGKPVTEIWLSQQLRPYGARPKNIRIEGKQGKGYDLADLKQTFRYIPRAEIENMEAEAASASVAL